MAGALSGCVAMGDMRGMAPAPSAPRGDEPAAPAPTEPVADFVRRERFGGVPWEEASRYGAADTPMLLRLLADPAEEGHWVHVVAVLGAAGDQAAVEPLIRFMEAGGHKRLSRAGWAARSSVPLALGYSLYANGSRRAQEWLAARARPEGWGASGLRWLPPGKTDAAGRDRTLSMRGIMGLALSGRPAARTVLREALAGLETKQGGADPSGVRELLEEAIEANEFIQREGLGAYYRREVR